MMIDLWINQETAFTWVKSMSHYAPDSEGLLKPLEPWLSDPLVSEIILNRPKEVFVEKEGTFTQYLVEALNKRMLRMLFQLIANENEQKLSESKPILSGSLLDGSRVQLVMPPTAKNLTFSIRRKVVRNLSLNVYQSNNFYQYSEPFSLQVNQIAMLPTPEKKLLHLYKGRKWHEFIALAIELKKNIVISGGTSSGKTTFLNACLQHISKQDRIITLEDTYEIDISHPNQVNLLASKGDQGLAKVSMQDLVQCCLRLRPDRIIMGEIRGKEIMDFISACSTGHEGSLTSIHANNPKIAFMRMTQMYKLNNVPSMTDEDILNELKEVIDIVIQIQKTHAGRFVSSVYYKYGDL